MVDQYCFSLTSLESICIPSGVKQISIRSFYICTKLKYVQFEINSELKKIGEYAFFGSSIHSIAIPSNVVEIGDQAFGNCENLHIIDFSQSSKLKLMKRNTFSFSPLDIIMTSK